MKILFDNGLIPAFSGPHLHPETEILMFFRKPRVIRCGRNFKLESKTNSDFQKICERNQMFPLHHVPSLALDPPLQDLQC